MPEYFGEGWKKILAANHLDNFDALWDLKTDWFEEPNVRRGGWSGVVKVDLDTPEGTVGVFIKRQQNHMTKVPLHPVKGILTFEREFKNIFRLRKQNVPTLEPVYFSTRKVNGDRQAILVTKELSGYIPLNSERFLMTGDLIVNREHKNRLLYAVADVLRKMHNHHFQHNCMYLKHIFVKPNEDSWDIKIIDLEKLKWSFFKKNAVFRDLYTLHRFAGNWSRKDLVKFYQAYMQESKLSQQSKSLWHSIENKIITKKKAGR